MPGPQPAPSLAAESADHLYPLSLAQRAMWLDAEIRRDESAYETLASWRLEGPLEIAALDAALNGIVERHAALRTSFTVREGVPMQRVHPWSWMPCEVRDLSAARDREHAAAAEADAFAAVRVDLETAPLIRWRLLRLGPQVHVLMIATHHLVADGASWSVFSRELRCLYTAHVQRRPHCLQELPVGYGAYAARQQATARSPRYLRRLEYWRQQLSGLGDSLHVPGERLPVAGQRPRADRVPIALDRELVDRLRAFARGEGATLYMVFLAALQALLHRYTHEQDLVVATTVSGRSEAALEPLIGLFANTLLLRANVRPEMSLRELVRAARASALAAYAHGDVAIDDVLRQIGASDTSRRGPARVVLNMQQTSGMDGVTLPGLTVTPEPLGVVHPTFDLLFGICGDRAELQAWCEYDAHRFDAPLITRMTTHWRRLLEAIVDRPDQPIADVPLLSEDERDEILVRWNDTQTPYPRDCSLPELVLARAARQPDTIALVYGDRALTYAALAEQAGRMARALHARGVSQESRVALLLPRSVEIVVAMLGVLMAGAAFAPVEPDLPRERLEWLLDDLRPSAVVCAAGSEPLVPIARDKLVVVCAGRPLPLPIGTPVAVARDAQQLAYVMYTSGSTGRPKGVGIPDRGVIRLVCENPFAEMSARTVMLQQSPAGFDASTFEIWGALVHGGRLVIAAGDRPTLADIIETIDREGVNLAFFTTALFDLLASQRYSTPPCLRELVIGGDAASSTHVRAWLLAHPWGRLVNGYGPTESTTFASTHAVESADAVGETMPIGRPIANTRLYVLDAALCPTPRGVMGHLWIAGDGLARGYFRRPAATAEAFIPNPYGAPGERMYRTGDLARLDDDATLRFHGRRDDQVKVRGFRIEPREIQETLREHADVADAVVICATHAGDKQLVAYVTASNHRTVTPRDLTSYLRGRLPSYLVPAAIVVLPDLPLTPNGKIDRNALPPPFPTRAERSDMPARTELEERLATIWSELLGVEAIQPEDSFFELGGHSLLAMRVVAALRETFAVSIGLREMFVHHQLRDLASHLEGVMKGPDDAAAPPGIVARAGDGDACPLSYAQQRLWFLEQLHAGRGRYNIGGALRLDGPLDLEALARAFTALVARHPLLRARFESRGEGVVQITEPVVDARPRLVRLDGLGARARDERLLELTRAHMTTGFDLERGDLLRVVVLRMAAHSHVLLFVMPHIIGDGWSVAVIARDLSMFYSAFVSGHTANLTDVPVRYADWAAWQRDWLDSGAMDRQLRYWTQRLAGLPEISWPAPSADANARATRAGSALETISVPPDVARRARAVSADASVTPFMTTLAAFAALVRRHSGQPEVLVGTDVTNRGRAEIEQVVGLFVNQLALRLDASGNPSFRELLERVRSSALSAFANQDVPFERVVQAVRPGRHGAEHPLFNVLFTYRKESPLPSLAGLRVTPVQAPAADPRLDVTMTIEEAPDDLRVLLEYRADLWSAPAARALLEQYVHILDTVTRDPAIGIDAIPLVSMEERTRLIDEFLAVE